MALTSAYVAPFAQAQVRPHEKDDTPIGIFQCGGYPTSEYIDDTDGTFIYRKINVAWQQGHENTYQKIKIVRGTQKPDITTSLSGHTCTLTMNFERTKKVFRYQVCSEKNSASGGCARVAQVTDISPVKGPSTTNTCSVMTTSYGNKSKFPAALAKCQAPAVVTKKNQRPFPAACKDTSTGVKIEPYTCSYIKMPDGKSSQSLVTAAEVGAKFCTDRVTSSICTAKVRCTWNNKLKWAGHVKVYDTFVYCPTTAGACNRIDAMTCSTNTALYFDGDSGEKLADRLRKKYDIPDYKSSAQ